MTTRVALLGPGRVGTALALALPPERYTVTAVAGRGRERLDAFSTRFPEVAVAAPAVATRSAELVLVCVPDDELVPLVRAVAAEDGVTLGSRWVHTAGGHGTASLHPARLAGARTAACHPAQTFPDPQTGAAALPGSAWAVTAEQEEMEWAEALVRDLGGDPQRVDEASRVLYHAGLAIGANGTSAVVAQAREVLLGAGVREPEAFLAPLVQAAAGNAARIGAAALTGPVRRGDAGTVSRHVEELRAVLPEALEPYRALARLALGQAQRAGLDETRVAAVAAALEEDG